MGGGRGGRRKGEGRGKHALPLTLLITPLLSAHRAENAYEKEKGNPKKTTPNRHMEGGKRKEERGGAKMDKPVWSRRRRTRSAKGKTKRHYPHLGKKRKGWKGRNTALPLLLLPFPLQREKGHQKESEYPQKRKRKKEE